MLINDYSTEFEDYQKIETAIQFITTNFKTQPTLDEMAASIHLSKFHFNRLFKRWAGVTPIQFTQFLTLEYTKQKLVESKTVLEASFDAGLSGSGRLHDLFVNFESMTPGEYKRMGSGLNIQYGFGKTPFGECLLACTTRGICHLGFVTNAGKTEAFNQLQMLWPDANYIENTKKTADLILEIFNVVSSKQRKPFHLHLKGTNYQVNVWKALLSIPAGNMLCYKDIALHIGNPTGFRAVANAIAANPVGYLIPCHRVIAKNGEIHQYRWGAPRKKAMIGYEIARSV